MRQDVCFLFLGALMHLGKICPLCIKMYIHPIMEYACPVWHTSVSKAQSDQLELVQKWACRIIMAQRYTSYRAALETLGLVSLHERREQLLVRFGKSLQASIKKHSRLLPVTKGARHGRKLRYAQQIDPPRCKRTRYKTSAHSSSC